MEATTQLSFAVQTELTLNTKVETVLKDFNKIKIFIDNYAKVNPKNGIA
jgi:hypothetical protein